jgi:8-oxo-dGTP pyrophosphatase MutT (NUDIX family)
VTAGVEEIVLAILTVGDRYVLQLRDNDPRIEAPGRWGLFGGGREPGESAEDAIRRDLAEELTVQVDDVSFLWSEAGGRRADGRCWHYWLFEVDFAPFWGRETLQEGQAAGLFVYNETQGLNLSDSARTMLARHAAQTAVRS